MSDLKNKKPDVADASVDPVVIECINCGLPQCQNPHPDAGKPKHVNWVGASYGCLPCAEKRANGRATMIYYLRRWAEDEGRETGSNIRKEALQDVVNRINQLEDERREAFAASR